MFWDAICFGTPLIIAKIIIFQGCKFWDISKIYEKMGNFVILSFGTNQNFAFLAKILTPKMHAYTVIFIFLSPRSATFLSVKTACIL